MYASRLRSRRIDPVGLGGATLIGGAIVFAMINIAPNLGIKDPIPVFPVINIPADPPKPIEKVTEPPKKHVETLRVDPVVLPPIVPVTPQQPVFVRTAEVITLPPPTDFGTAEGKGV